MSKPLKLKNSMAGSVRSVRTDKSMKSDYRDTNKDDDLRNAINKDAAEDKSCVTTKMKRRN